MFGGTTIFYVEIWNHPIETTIKNWLFGVPGKSQQFFIIFGGTEYFSELICLTKVSPICERTFPVFLLLQKQIRL